MTRLWPFSLHLLAFCQSTWESNLLICNVFNFHTNWKSDAHWLLKYLLSSIDKQQTTRMPFISPKLVEVGFCLFGHLILILFYFFVFYLDYNLAFFRFHCCYSANSFLGYLGLLLKRFRVFECRYWRVLEWNCIQYQISLVLEIAYSTKLDPLHCTHC